MSDRISARTSIGSRLAAGFASLLLLATVVGAWTPVAAASPMTITNVDSPDPVVSGAQILYTITVTNTGGAKVTEAVLTDQVNGVVGFGNPPLLDVVSSRGGCTQANTQITCTAGTIEGGGVWTITVRGIVTAPGGTTINNIATVTATKSATTFTNSASSTTQVTGSGPGGSSPDLTIGKNGPLTVTPGGSIVYTLTVNNVGTANAVGVKVRDTVPAAVTITGITATSLFSCPTVPVASNTIECTDGRINAGANGTITITGTVGAAASGQLENTSVVDPENTIDEGELGNTADAAELNNQSNTVVTTISPVPPPPNDVISIDAIGPATAIPNEVIHYTLTVTNGTLGRADYVTVTNGTQGLQAASLKVESATAPDGGTTPVCTVSAPTVTCTMTRLPVGGHVIVKIAGTVVAAAGSTIIDSAKVTANVKNTGYSATDEIQTIINAGKDLTITKSDMPDPVCASSWPNGGVTTDCKGGLSYTFKVGNSGVQDATNVLVRDALPAGTTYDDAASSPLCDAVAGVVSCTIPTLHAGETLSITIVLVAPAVLGQITNTVTVDPFNAILEADETNNVAVEKTTVATGIDLTIAKGDNPATGSPDGFDPIATSGTQTYRITVDNLGTQDASNILIRDTLPAGTIFLSAKEIDPNGAGFPGLHSITCTHNGAPTGGVVDCTGGSLLGTANESYFPPAPGDDKITIEIKVFARPTVGIMHNEARVDPLGTIAEYNESNNIVTQDTTVTTGDASKGAFNELTVSKTQTDPAGNQVATSSTVTYQIVVTNAGTDPAVMVEVLDTLPAGFTFLSALDTAGALDSSSFICSAGSGNTVDCTGATLSGTVNAIAGVPTSRTIEVRARSAAAPGNYVNTARVDPNNQIPEGNETNNQSQAPTTVKVGTPTGFIDLQISKCDEPNPPDLDNGCTVVSDPVAPSGTITYVVKVSNAGTDPAFNVKFVDGLPAGTTFVSAVDQGSGAGAFTCAYAAGLVTCTGGTLDGSLDLVPSVATSRTVKIVVTAPAGKGPITNQVVVDPDNAIAESNETNNSDTETTNIVPRINLTLDKQGPETAHQNDEDDYVITVKNELPTGITQGLTAHNVRIVDALPVGLIPLSWKADPGNFICNLTENPVNGIECIGDLAAPDVDSAKAQVTITIHVFVTAKEGPLDNEACVDPTSADLPNGVIIESDEGDNCKTKTTTVLNLSPDLHVQKTADATNVTPGQEFSYKVVVSNNGDATAQGGFIITDKLDTTRVDHVSSSATNSYSCSFSSPNVTCSGGSLAPGDATTITIKVKVKTGATGTIVNEASVPNDTAFDGSAPECGGGNCANEAAANTTSSNSDNKDTVNVSVGGSGIDLVMLSLDDSEDATTTGGIETYTAKVSNNGTADVTAVTVRLELPATGLNHVMSSASNGFSCVFLFPNIDCTGNLPAGATTTVTLVTSVTASAPPDKSVTVKATVDPANTIVEDDETNNVKSATTTVTGSCATGCTDIVASSIVVSPATVHVGDTATFIVGVGNAGDNATGEFSIKLKLTGAGFDFDGGGFDASQPSDDYSATPGNTTGFDCTYPGLGDTVTCKGDLNGGQGVLIILNVHATSDATGHLNLEVNADSENDVNPEFSDSNNSKTASVDVLP